MKKGWKEGGGDGRIARWMLMGRNTEKISEEET